jgi:predicted GNAT superfamily acetyltransferase
MIRDAARADWPVVLALNAESVAALSPLDEARLAKLAAAACYFRIIEQNRGIAAFLLGFRKGADYDSPNFLWFDRSFDDFVYVDRVVVAPAFRGQRLADGMYNDFEAFARDRGVSRVTCEVNVEPPNPVSLSFHARRGFREIGRLPYGEAKIVALLERTL